MPRCFHDEKISFCSTHEASCPKGQQYPVHTSREELLAKEAQAQKDTGHALLPIRGLSSAERADRIDAIAKRCFEIHILLVCLDWKQFVSEDDARKLLDDEMLAYKEEDRKLRAEAAELGFPTFTCNIQAVFNREVRIRAKRYGSSI